MFYIILTLVEIPLFINFLVDKQSGLLHLFTWLAAVLITLGSLEVGAFLAVLTLCWFEIPLLWLGYPNQFLSDIVLMGLMAGSLGHRSCREVFKRIEFDWVTHPVAFALLLAIPLALSQLLVSVFELHRISADGWGLRSVITSIAARLYNWDIERDFFHRFSAVNAFLIHFLVAFFFVQAVRRGLLNSKVLLRGFILGTQGVAIYGFFQIIGLIPIVYTTDIGGTLQNGNLLSFVGALALFVEFYLLLHTKKELTPSKAVFTCLIICNSMFALLAGVGRISWINCMLALGLFIPVAIKNVKVLRKVFNLRIFIGLGVFVGLVVLVFFSLRHVGSMSGASSEIVSILESPSLIKIISAGGRMEHFAKAVTIWQDHFIEGIGLDAFYLRGSLGLDIHNLALKWGTEMGLFGFIAAILAIFAGIFSILRVWVKFDLKNTSVAALGLVALAPALGDSTLNYKSMLVACTICTLPLAETLISLNGPLSRAKRRSKIWACVIIFSLFFMAGLLTIPKPQPLVNFIGGYGSEKEPSSPSKVNYWQSLATILPVSNSKRCHDLTLRALIRGHKNSIKIAAVAAQDPALKGFSTLSEIDQYETNLGMRLRHLEQVGEHWQTMCFCLPIGKKTTGIYLRSDKGDVINFAKGNFGPDFRFISYGLAANPPLVMENEDRSSCIDLD